MAITTKPSKKGNQVPELDPEKLDAFLNKGGDVPSAPKAVQTMQAAPLTQARTKGRPPKPKGGRIVLTQVRLPEDKVAEIDAAIALRKVKVSRHTWLLEAIEAHLESAQG